MFIVRCSWAVEMLPLFLMILSVTSAPLPYLAGKTKMPTGKAVSEENSISLFGVTKNLALKKALLK